MENKHFCNQILQLLLFAVDIFSKLNRKWEVNGMVANVSLMFYFWFSGNDLR